MRNPYVNYCPRSDCDRSVTTGYGFTPWGLGGYRYCNRHGFVAFSPETETAETERARREAAVREAAERAAARAAAEERRRAMPWWRRLFC